MLVDEIAEAAMAALRSEDPAEARDKLEILLDRAPQRIDLRHALAVTLLRLGEPGPALAHLDAAIAQALAQRDESAAAMMSQLHLARAAACEDTYDPYGAEDAYRQILRHEPGHPRALQALGHLLLSWGRSEEGLALLQQYIDEGGDGPEFVEATQGYVDAARRFIDEDIHPRSFLEAHRGVYVEFFDHHADRLEKEGWIAEAARMQRLDDGSIAPVIPDGARPYAAVRLDLVDPNTGREGQIAEGPMQAALPGYEPLAQGMILIDWPGHDFPVFVSSVCPWNWLPVQIRIRYNSDPVTALDPTIGDWYTAGFDGAYGLPSKGRFHFIAPPERIEERAVLYYVDCGRTTLEAVDDLLRRLVPLMSAYKIEAVLIGRGFIPEVPDDSAQPPTA